MPAVKDFQKTREYGLDCVREIGTGRYWCPEKPEGFVYARQWPLPLANHGTPAAAHWCNDAETAFHHLYGADCCLACGSIDGVLVATGVDEQGEWQSCECNDCGHTWLIR